MKTILVSALLGLVSLSASAITPQEAYKEICNLPTVQQSMPETQLNIGSKIILFGAQTAASVATGQTQLNTIAQKIDGIILQINEEYFVAQATDGNVVVTYFAQKTAGDLYDILRVQQNIDGNYSYATYAQTTQTAINELKRAQMEENAAIECE